MTTGGKGLAPARFFGSELQHSPHACSRPRGTATLDLLVFRQEMKPILEWIFSCNRSQFIQETLTGKTRLQGVHRSHPSQRHWSFQDYQVEREIRDSVDQRGLIGDIGIGSIGRLRAFLNINGWRDDAM